METEKIFFPPENDSDSQWGYIFIPENDEISECGYFTMNEIVDMLRKYKYEPEKIQFIADMLEE